MNEINKQTQTKTGEVKELPHLTCSQLYRSSVSGLWYKNHKAAGDIDCIEINGERLEKEFYEGELEFISRAFEWAKKFASENH